MAGASVWLAERSSDDTRWVAHSLGVENELSLLQLAVRRAESGQRGYLLTQDPDYLKVYEESVQTIPTRMANLKAMVDDNSEQTARVQQLAEVVAAKHDELLKIADLQRQGRNSDALAIIRDPAGQATMGSFTDVGTAVRTAERALLADRTARSAATARWLLATTLLGAVAIMVLAGISILLIRRSNLSLARAQQALAESNSHLEEKVAERTVDLQDANDELQRFAYIVSHDLRSPLVNIMGFTGELDAIRRDLIEQDRRDADEQRSQIYEDFDEALGFIKASISKMDRLINAILNLSRAGRRDFNPQQLDLNQMLKTIQDAVMHQAQEADAVIEIGPMPTIESDRLAIEQIFSNLVDNAVKYLKPGRPGRIGVTATERGGFVIIRVEDNGRGIDAADRERVFELFRRAGAQDRPGEGIGLAHVRALVRRVGGKIRLDSEPGEGSTFTVILPRSWRA
ncbi:CHASE3 domain-containing protein [Mesorhizobium sp. BR1-1-16]|uniref:sensor histidine kinase n=1 Tax=Mesorhizobium sp. BR1-1-16 TaxID=2876653 RepID=UPI001CCFE93D|nr:CHASE3 domain-containing protein [Mesorhizobium sp. BR1-1-16]MBZ9937621.1 CHASE3 domain-containing protein [Mesorhizobium sp. BR1-1-16]